MTETNFRPEVLQRAASVGPQSARARNPIASFGSVADVDKFLTPAVEDCAPGMEPVEYNVVVAPSVLPEKIGSIILADESSDRMELAMQMGRVISVSPIAFNYDTWPQGADHPGVGDIVWFARFAGGVFVGRDGKNYRLIKDKDINAVIRRAS